MSLEENQYDINQSAFWAAQNVNRATNEFRCNQLSEHLRQYDEVEEVICSICGDPIYEGDDYIELDDGSTAHWDCFNKENGDLL